MNHDKERYRHKYCSVSGGPGGKLSCLLMSGLKILNLKAVIFRGVEEIAIFFLWGSDDTYSVSSQSR